MLKAGFCSPGPIELIGLAAAATAERERLAWNKQGKEIQPPYGATDSEDEDDDPDQSNEQTKETILGTKSIEAN